MQRTTVNLLIKSDVNDQHKVWDGSYRLTDESDTELKVGVDLLTFAQVKSVCGRHC